MKFAPTRSLPLLAILAASISSAQEKRGDEADSKPHTPEEERALFKLPPGFEIQLVAAEPEIQKPMNLNFDAMGRLWVSGSEMYPFATRTEATGQAIPNFDKEWQGMSGNKGGGFKLPEPPADRTDSIRVLSNFGPDGRARKIEVFADKLNIPIGLTPLPRKPGAKGDTIIAHSIPNIYRLEDTDGDGRADKREILYGSIGFKDTHGMSSNYLQWIDGWIYACHGFANHSEVRDGSGTVTVIDSGNTVRFRPDGSHFEVFTNGQTNPFGLAFDPLGNFYTCDSHSKPSYLLLRGAHYEGIGKKHDGLGFSPTMMQHSHGSSSIAGIAYYSAQAFPGEYRDNLFIGNPVTRRVNRDRLEWTGTTPKAIEMPDFLTSDDPWFRPVQVRLGPDGALYIADFYNPIIGHYEHPLGDPRRDHAHGRIWRIVATGAKTATPPDLTRMDATQLAQAAEGNLEVRRLATLNSMKVPAFVPGRLSELAAKRPSLPEALAQFKAAPEGDTHLRHALRVCMREAVASGTALDGITGEDARIVADVCLAVPTPKAAEFLLGELTRTKFGAPRAGEYLRHIAKNIPAEKIGDLAMFADKLKDAPAPQQIAFADGLAQAVRERGLKLPDSLGPWLQRAVFAGLDSKHATVDQAIAAVRDSSDGAKLEPLRKIVKRAGEHGPRRAAALEATMNLPQGIETAIGALNDTSSMTLRRKAAELLAQRKDPECAKALIAALPSAPGEIAQLIAGALAKNDASCEAMLGVIESGKASPALLRQTVVAAGLAGRPAPLRERATALTKDLPPENVRLDTVIGQRVEAFRVAQPDLAKGRALFNQHCAVCHKFRGEGASVAPNLDGVGPSRGAHRLIEDILDPNRNVDATFRTVVIETRDGQMVAGVNLREGDGGLTITDVTGKDVAVKKANEKTRMTSALSLMPPAFEQMIPASDFSSLVGYLLQP